MAQKAKWDLAGDIATCILPSGVTMTFDMSKLYGLWDKFDHVEKVNSYYGMKQVVMDRGARPADAKLTDEERKEVAEKQWNLMTVERKFTSGTKAAGVRTIKQDRIEEAWEKAKSSGTLPKGMTKASFIEAAKAMGLTK